MGPYIQQLSHLLASVLATARGGPDGAHAAFAQWGVDAISVTVTRTKVSLFLALCILGMTLSCSRSSAGLPTCVAVLPDAGRLGDPR